MQCIEKTFRSSEAKSLTQALKELEVSSSFSCFIVMGAERLRNIGSYYYVDVIYDDEKSISPTGRNLFASRNREEALFAEYYYRKALVQTQQEELRIREVS